MHLTAPLQIARVDKRFAKSRGAAEVNAQNSIAAVCKPLMHGVVAPVVACPWSTMGEQHHRQWLIRTPIGITVASNRQRVVTDQVQPITRLDDCRVHLCERQTFQCPAMREQELCALFFAVIAIILHRTIIQRVGDHPVVIVECSAHNLDITISNRF